MAAAIAIAVCAIAVFVVVRRRRPALEGTDWRAVLAVGGALAIVFVLAGVLYVASPRSIVLEVEGPPGTPFVGNVTLDQTPFPIRGTTPETFTWRARHAAFNVLPAAAPASGFRARLAGHEAEGWHGLGGWYDARGLVPDVGLRPISEGDWTILQSQLNPQPVVVTAE